MEIRKKEGEAASSLVYRFNKRVQQSGIIKEVKKRRFKKRAESKIKKRISAIYKNTKLKEVQKLRKLGKI
ncbi:MAG: hypothetical protein A2430_02210 [Candidatus Liptonbacteria bacterium RIFOXYC1_FULL_36_8]|uniref:30S ribosomal protein S21 n=3 Tax=Candidatus Liptoniibacteriota TaxID=1817909 RepID=A0A1G2CPF5_9BACT|nr:MAG: hypothetical protein A2390_00225 [Candidatus Liptonbacteria bacterium RIFOXYB1_FULL_36_10]OGZ03965.1 MAG: hypothetical protein A2430_02210 [Candidatus Liptonbacteria bacterium RIFOXYC1_FULL_36_8]OGZ04372.1 MAG: hypothetical protein A2604_01705 [Candidatus Liptonbacteria bacterium RIFOXYD1_FULL_36_11]